jgi:hypothetical protein
VLGLGIGLGIRLGLGIRFGLGLGLGIRFALGIRFGLGLGLGIRFGLGLGLGIRFGLGLGLGIRFGLGVRLGLGACTAIPICVSYLHSSGLRTRVSGRSDACTRQMPPRRAVHRQIAAAPGSARAGLARRWRRGRGRGELRGAQAADHERDRERRA